VEKRNEAEAERLFGLVRESLDQPNDPGDLARKAYRSRSDFFRLFRALIEETPGSMRRRFLLERAAWQLGRTRLAVTEIAFDANYGSLEAFTRAFRKAFRISPSLYRRMGARHIQLPAPNGFHFHACVSGSEGANKTVSNKSMDLFDLFSGADSWHTRRLLEQAKNLTDEQLDRPLNSTVKVFPWDTPDQNLRDILERIVQTKEVWTAALTGRTTNCLEPGTPEDRKPATLLARFDKVDGEFQGLMEGVRNRSAWQDTFVDALCEPPEVFTFGGMFAHMMTFNAYRRLNAISALRGLGVEVEGFGCPTEYEATVAPREERAVSHS
jgi:AraC-like DNA-binding protein